MILRYFIHTLLIVQSDRFHRDIYLKFIMYRDIFLKIYNAHWVMVALALSQDPGD